MSSNEINTFSGLSEEVGARLSERRSELAKTLRDVASAAEVSVGHLSEIENGRSQVSLPVLLRLMKALDLTVSELLPRIGGSRSRSGALIDLKGPTDSLSHDQLELQLDHHRIEQGSDLELKNPLLEDLLVHVLSGRVSITANDQQFELGTGDTFNSERLARCHVVALEESTLLTGTRKAQP